MNKNIVDDYKAKQVELLGASKYRIQSQGYLSGYQDLYPDINLGADNVGYSRTGSPLLFSLLMYDKSALLVPSLSQQALEARFGMKWDVILGLIQSGVVQPIIKNPDEYQSPHLRSLIEITELNAPSVWTRGLTVLDYLDLNHLLDEMKCPLPVSNMATSEIIISRFRQAYSGVSDEQVNFLVKMDIMVNYADLCIFGKGQDAIDVLMQLPDDSKKVQWLYKFNEMQTYPHLFGFGGTANYSADILLSDSEMIPGKLPPSQLNPFHDQRELDIFLNGIGLSAPQLTAKTISEFHASGDGKRLREAVTFFENKANSQMANQNELTHEELLAAEERLKRELINSAKQLASPGFIKKARSRDKIVQFSLQCGGLAAGAWVGALAPGMAIVGGLIGAGMGAKVLEKILLPLISEPIQEKARRLYMNTGLANLWTIRQRGGK